MPHLLPALVAGVLLLSASGAAAQMPHEHKAQTCSELSLACAASVTPVFAPDGTLWIAARTKDRIFVARSKDHGRTFSEPALVTQEPLMIDGGPDARPSIIVDREGRVIVAFAVRDKSFNGQVLHSRSLDGGKTFSKPQPITSDTESQRFVALALDSDGAVFSAWIDKRNRRAAREKGEDYKGAALAFAWSDDHGARFTDAVLAREPTCECCRIAVAFAGSGRPVVLFRNIFDGGVRDHAIITFADRTTPGPLMRVSEDQWAIDACPHHGPSLAVAPSGTYHAAWYTAGAARKGLFYARSTNSGESFSDPLPVGNPDRAPGRPNLIAAGGKIWLAWKEFDGAKSRVMVMASPDDGLSWSPPKAIADTAEDSDHPILVSDGRSAFLSWQTQAEGYRLLVLEEGS